MTACGTCAGPIEGPNGPTAGVFVSALERLGVPPICGPCGDRAELVSELAHEIHVAVLCSSTTNRWSDRVGIPIPKRYEHVTLDSYECGPGKPGDGNALLLVRDWLENPDRGLYLHGRRNGSGKTHLAFAAATAYAFQPTPMHDPSRWPKDVPDEMVDDVLAALKREVPAELVIRRRDLLAASVADLLGEMRCRYGRDDDAEEIVHAIQGCEVLLLDDLGAERSTEWAVEQLFRAIDRRVAEERMMIITSNHSPVELADKLSDTVGPVMAKRIASRLMGACLVVQVNAPDYRIRSHA